MLGSINHPYPPHPPKCLRRRRVPNPPGSLSPGAGCFCVYSAYVCVCTAYTLAYLMSSPLCRPLLLQPPHSGCALFNRAWSQMKVEVRHWDGWIPIRTLARGLVPRPDWSPAALIHPHLRFSTWRIPHFPASIPVTRHPAVRRVPVVDICPYPFSEGHMRGSPALCHPPVILVSAVLSLL